MSNTCLHLPCDSRLKPSLEGFLLPTSGTKMMKVTPHWSPLLIPRSRVLENLNGFQLVKKLIAFYGNRKFTTAFTSSRHLPRFSATSILHIPLPEDPSTPGFSKWSLSLRFPHQNPLLTPMCATCPAYPILLDFITRTIIRDAAASFKPDT